MLDTLRKAAGSLVAKILFGILVLSFAVWGIGDIFRGAGRQSYVAQIGDQKIGRETLMSEYNRYLEQLRPMFGGHLDTEMAKKLGFPQAVLQQMAGRAVFDQASQDLGLAIGDATIRAKIENDQAFKGPGGKFDEITFRRALMEAGFTEDSYVSGLRRDIVRQVLIDSVRNNGKSPASMAAALYRVREEKRTADAVAVPDASLPDPAEPDDAALAAYHKDHAAAFTAPEYRGVTYLALTPADLAKDVEVTDEDLRQAYEDNKARFTTPERRTVSQIVTPNQADAERAEKMLAEGKDFADVAKEVANQDKDAIDLGTLAKEQLPKELRDPAFALAEGGATQPIKTALGWHILKATAIAPGSVKSFDEVRDGLRQDIAQDRARDRIDATSNKLDDTLAAGASLEEAAEKLGLKVAAADAIDNQGRDPKGDAVAGLPGGNFLPTAFSAAEGKPSTLTEIPNGGYFVLRVDKITPSALRPLAEVREIVASAWRGEQRHQAAKARAEAIAQKIKGGKPLADAVAEFDLKAKSAGPFKRDEHEVLPADVVKALFAAKTGEAATGEDKDGYVVAQLRDIAPADPAADKDGVAAVQQQLDGAFGTDYVVQYGGGLEKRYPVKFNAKIFDALFAGS